MMTEQEVHDRIDQAQAEGFYNWTDGMFWVPDSDNEVGRPEGLVTCVGCGRSGYYASGWRHPDGRELWLHRCYECGWVWIVEAEADGAENPD